MDTSWHYLENDIANSRKEIKKEGDLNYTKSETERENSIGFIFPFVNEWFVVKRRLEKKNHSIWEINKHEKYVYINNYF
jgi:hypothetical protein